MSEFELDWFKYLKCEPKVIMDIGSYNGTDAKRFKEKYPNARVLAVEASPKNFERMVKINKLDAIELFHCAIGDIDGDIEFHDTLGRLTGSGSILKPKDSLCEKYQGTELKKEKIKIKRIDTLCKENNIQEIDFIHMDIQTAEYLALVGLGKLRPKMIFLEMEGDTANHYNGAINPEIQLKIMGYVRLKKLRGDQLWILKKLIL